MSIAGVQCEAWRVAYRELMPASFLETFTPQSRAPAWHATLSRVGEATIEVLEDLGGAVVGFVAYRPLKDEESGGELVIINVLPSHWGQGLGRAALHHVVQQARTRMWRSVSLWVFEQNRRARYLYEQFGFRQTSAPGRLFEFNDVQLLEVQYEMRV